MIEEQEDEEEDQAAKQIQESIANMGSGVDKVYAQLRAVRKLDKQFKMKSPTRKTSKKIIVNSLE